MLFNSQIFIFVFLPLTLLGWYTINHFRKYNLSLIFLIGMSLWFYGYFNPGYLIILISSIAVNYLVSFLMERFKKLVKPLFYVGLLLNLLLLGYYKYYDFFIENINWAFRASFALKHILLPLGISFFTLQQVSFLVDRYWGVAPHYGIIEYAAYVTFFPQLIAGPIVLHSELLPQFRDLTLRKFNKDNFMEGLVWFFLGLIKKVILADTFARIVNHGFDNIYSLDTLSAWFVALGYTFELYFDFSGYCDMACGLGKMFNFDIPVNFKSPYKSHSISEYWTRWHATLTRFFTSYIFNPMTLNGVRKNKKKLYSYLTPMVVFLISGIWHGASWTFIIWGILHGLATIWGHRKHFKIKKHKWLAWFGTFFFTIVTQTIFRCESLTNMWLILKNMFTFRVGGISTEISIGLKSDILIKGIMDILTPYISWQTLNLLYFLTMLAIFIVGALILAGPNAVEIINKQKAKGYTISFIIVLSMLVAYSIVSLSEVSTFLYFNF